MDQILAEISQLVDRVYSVVLGQDGASMFPGNTWGSVEQKEKSKIYIDPEESSDYFHYI